MNPHIYNLVILGSGTWATAIARNIGRNALNINQVNNIVKMYVSEEEVDDQRLTDIINETHYNKKYLPGFLLPDNVIAVGDLVESSREADILVFAMSSMFVLPVCRVLLGKIKPTAMAVSIVKGYEKSEDDQVLLISQLIQKELKITCSCLIGSNMAYEVANNNFCEGTLGSRNQKYNSLLHDLFKSSNFLIQVTDDADAIETFATLANIIAFATALTDAMGYHQNMRSAIIRRGYIEMIKYIDYFSPGSKMATMLQPCGISDLIISCHANRNFQLAEAFVKTGKPLCDLERVAVARHEQLGPVTAQMVNIILTRKGLADNFPLFSVINNICIGHEPLESLLEIIRETKENVYKPLHLFPI